MIERYRDPAVEALWSRQVEIDRWRQVELAWLQQVSPEGYEQVRLTRSPTAAEVEELERNTRHEFIAFLTAWMNQWPAESDAARRWVHFGLTSSDVIDCGRALALSTTSEYLFRLVRDLNRVLVDIAGQLEKVYQVGRTHGQWAEPRYASVPMQVFATMVERQEIRLRLATEDLALADLSGPTGGRDFLDHRKVHAALRRLGLRRVPASTQIVPRDSMVHWAHVVANTVTVCEAIAEHYWMLAQSDVGEVRVANGSGSSTMPHKRANPHLAENVRGLARLARGLVSSLDESIVQRGDRDLAHSSVERVAIPDLCHLAATALDRTIGIVSTWRYDTTHIAENLDYTTDMGAASHTALCTQILVGNSREQALINTMEAIK